MDPTSTPPSTDTPQPSTTPPPATATAPPPQPPPPSLSLPQQSSNPPPSSSSLPSTSPNPNPSPRPPISQQQITATPNSQSRPPFNRPAWAQQQLAPSPQQTHSHFSQFSASSTPVPAFSSSASPPVSSLPPAQRGGMAIGVPATPPPTFSSLSPVQPPAFGAQQYSTFARSSVNMSDTGPRSITNQLRQPIQGIQGTGMMGSLGSSSAMRPVGVAAQHQHRPIQSSLRPQANPNTQSPNTQNFQSHSLLRASSVGSPSSSQSIQPPSQPWLSSGSQGKPPLPPTQFRPPLSTQSPQQRSILPPHHPMANAQHQQQLSSGQQSQSAEHYGQQYPPSRIHQQQIARGQGIVNQKPSSQPMIQSSVIQPSVTLASGGSGESCSRILSKRSIQELVAQIDPSEKLDPEVEDILVDIADEFVESITTYGCSLAKHRKSTTLEAKDILLHLERNWNMTLPGFSGDDIKGYRKPLASDIHRERLSLIKRSMLVSETSNPKGTAGQAGGNARSHLRAAANIVGSPNPRTREAS